MAWNGRHCDVLIAMPHSGGEVYMDWALEFAKIWKNAPPNTFVATAPEPQIDVAREKLAEIALSMNAKYIFWLDTDVLPGEHVINKLMKHNLPFVSGLYARRHYPCWNEMLMRGKDANGNEGYISIPEGSYEKGELITCDVVGFGCILMKTEILRSMEKPWFKWSEHRVQRGKSEDFWFCERAREAGIRIVVDTSVVCRHMGPIKILPGSSNNPMFEFKQPGAPISDL